MTTGSRGKGLFGAIGASVGILLGYLIISALAMFALTAIGINGAIAITLVGNALVCLAVLSWMVLAARTGRPSPMLPNQNQPRWTASRALLVTTSLTTALAVVWLVGQATGLLMRQRHLDSGFNQYQQAITDAPLAMFLIALLVSAPLTEELIMRALVYSRLRRVMSPMPAALISATMFAILHMTLVHLAYTITLGVLLAIAYETTRQIWVPIAMHMAFNLAAIVPASLMMPLAQLPFVVIGNTIVAVMLVGLPRALSPMTCSQTNDGAGPSGSA